MANTSDAVPTTPWPATAFYSTNSGAALSDVSGTWLSNATLYNDVLLNSTKDSPPRKILIPCDNAENLVDKATREEVEGLLLMTVLPSLELFGVTANVINCMVFVRQGLRDRINLCLFSLALADISFLLFMFSAKFFSFLGLFDKRLGGVMAPEAHEHRPWSQDGNDEHLQLDDDDHLGGEVHLCGVAFLRQEIPKNQVTILSLSPTPHL